MFRKSWIFFALQLLHFVDASTRDTPGFDAQLPKDYNKFVPPMKINGEPRNVSFAITLLRVQSVDEKNSAIALNLIFRLWWTDQRIETPPIPDGERRFLAKNYFDQMWLPDVYFRHAHYYDSPRLMEESFSLRAYDKHRFSVSKLLTVSLNCPMFFHFYPMDEQTCFVSLGSYMYTTEEVAFYWHGTGVDIDSDARLASGKFEFRIVKGAARISSSNATESAYPALDFAVIFRRKLSFYLMQAYVPSALLVMMSAFSFLVPAKGNVPARMTLCTVSALATSTMFAGIQQQLPEVSYAKAVDVWMLACLVFEASSFLEFCFVIQYGEFLRRQLAALARQNRPQLAQVNNCETRLVDGGNANNCESGSAGGGREVFSLGRNNEGIDSDAFRRQKPTGTVATELPARHHTALDELLTDRIDKAAFVIFSCTFIVFNFVYWSMYLRLFSSDMMDHMSIRVKG